MFKSLHLDANLSKNKKIYLLFEYATKSLDNICKNRSNNHPIKDYIYDVTIAANELDLDEELIGQLVDDYISQVFNTRYQFDNIINNLKELKDIDKEMKKIDLKNLVHKNLGVAKNLRIEDAQYFLNEMMIHDDIEYLKDCVDALDACAIKLNPAHAYGVLQVIELKNSF